MEFFRFVIAAVYFFLPAYVANMAPVIAAKMNLPLGTPIWRFAFGEHKTYRGFYSGIIAGIGVAYVQLLMKETAFASFYSFVIPDFDSLWWLYGLLLSFGALFGDLIKSLLKRCIGLKPGAPWPPFDQLDFVLGALFFVSALWMPSTSVVAVLVILSPILHVGVNVLAYELGFKDVWW